MDTPNDFDPSSWFGEQEPKDSAAASAAVAELSERWQAAHAERTKRIERELLRDRPKVTADEKVVLGLVAHDVALGEKLGRAEVQLAERLLAFADNPKLALQLAKTLRDVVACRSAASQRVEQLLKTAGVLRAQRQLSSVVPLRRVA